MRNEWSTAPITETTTGTPSLALEYGKTLHWHVVGVTVDRSVSMAGNGEVRDLIDICGVERMIGYGLINWFRPSRRTLGLTTIMYDNRLIGHGCRPSQPSLPRANWRKVAVPYLATARVREHPLPQKDNHRLV